MSYCNQEIKNNCLRSRAYILCSDAKDNPQEHNPASPPGGIAAPAGILLQFFDLREKLIRNKIVKFCAKGICMYPCVRPGDILHIEYRKIEEIQIGDIAVYRRGNNLFGHRVIDKGCRENRVYLLARSDTARGGSDGPIFNQDIAGIVAAVERKKHLLAPGKIQCSIANRIYLKFMCVFFRIKSLLIRKPPEE